MPIATQAINRSAKPFGASRVPSSGEQLGDQPGRGAAGQGRGILDPVHLEREGGGALLVRAPRLGSRGAAGGAQLLHDPAGIILQVRFHRSAERRLGKGGVSTGRSRWVPYA